MTFAIPPDRSAFSAGLEQRLASIGAATLPWDQLSAETTDLLVAASYAGEPFRLNVPTIFMAHGYGRTRDLAHSEEPREGDVPATRRVVHLAPHGNQLRFLPAWGERQVIGDPIFDDLVELQDQHLSTREDLDVLKRKLVVISSTWRNESLLSRHPGLIANLVQSLPMDEYAVAAILHPNIRARHSSWQVDNWLRPAVANGLRLIPDGLEWRPVVAAADVVIGDHGSVTFFADLLGLPLLRCHGALNELTPGSALEQRARSSPRLDVGEDIHQQLAQLEKPEHDDVQRFRGLAVDHPGEAIQRFRKLAYELMELGEPSPAPTHVAEISVRVRPEVPTIYRIRVTLERDGRVSTSRLPGATPLGPLDTIVGAWGEARTSALQSATILTLASAGPFDGWKLTDAILRDFPGCRTVASARGESYTLVSPEGRQTWRSEDGRPGEDGTVWAATLAAVLQWLIVPTDVVIERHQVSRRFVLEERR